MRPSRPKGINMLYWNEELRGVPIKRSHVNVAAKLAELDWIAATPPGRDWPWSGGDILSDPRKLERYVSRLVELLEKEGIKLGSLPLGVYLVLENSNFHTLNAVLECLGYYEPKVTRWLDKHGREIDLVEDVMETLLKTTEDSRLYLRRKALPALLQRKFGKFGTDRSKLIEP